MSELVEKNPYGALAENFAPDYDCMHYFLYGPCQYRFCYGGRHV